MSATAESKGIQEQQALGQAPVRHQPPGGRETPVTMTCSSSPASHYSFRARTYPIYEPLVEPMSESGRRM